MPLPRLRVEVRNKFLVNAGFLALLALIVVIITLLYISSEHNLHWWIDWYYPAIRIATTFRESPTEAIKLVQETLVEERNRLYVLPLVPFILTFGTSRLVYEVSLALVYLLPFALAMGAIAAQLIQAHRRIVFWSTAVLTLLIPVSWASTFMGIPDTGGALFIALATLVYLQDIRLKRWWRVPLIGLLIGLASLLRRHFIYGGVALLGAITLQALLFFYTEVRQIPPQDATASRLGPLSLRSAKAIAWRNLLLVGLRIGLIAATALATMMAIAPEFTQRALTVNYRTLYTSWSLPLGDVISLYAYYYGWATLLIVAIGFSAAILTRAVPLPAISLIGLSGVFSLIIWLVVLRYGNIFYSLHITPLVVIGLAVFIWTSWIRLTGKVRTLMLSVVGCYLVGNLVIGLTPIGQFDSVFRPLFALSTPPLVRTDYNEVVRLVKYLRQLAPNEEPIFVVGYQRLQLDSSLVAVAEWMEYRRDRRILNLLAVPKVDSRDEYPLDTLLQAKYVVVPDHITDYPGVPTKVPAVGEWVPNKELEVVQVVVDAFNQNWEFARDFKRLPVQFKLVGNTAVSIYQRTRPTSLETAVRTLHAMQQQIGKRPGSQLDWIVLSQPLNNSFVSGNADKTNRLVAYGGDRSLVNVSTQAGKGSPAEQSSTKLPRLVSRSADRTQKLGASFLYLGSLPEKAQLTGAITNLDNSCVNSSIRLAMLNKEGQIVSATETSAKVSSKFKLPIRGKNSTYLLLEALTYDKNNLINSCTIEIDSLAISAQK
jgi:hypothetical protein